MFAGVFFAQVSLISVLWQAGLCPLTPVLFGLRGAAGTLCCRGGIGLCPLTPDPSPPLGARGGFCVFGLQWKSRMAPLAPGRGEGPGVRGEVPLGAGFAEPRMSTDEGCFSRHG